MFIITVNKRQLVLGAVGVLIACAIAAASLLLGPLAPTQASEETDGINLPILMYHSILKDNSRAGKYVISPDTIEQDMLYLKDHGYTTVVMADLIDYVENGTPLPEKPVMLTFDAVSYTHLPHRASSPPCQKTLFPRCRTRPR